MKKNYQVNPCAPLLAFSRRNYFWILVALVCTLNIWFFMSLKTYIIACAGHDDALFVKLASSIIKGEWLGRYDRLTLIKGCFYPVFIGISYLMGIPLLIAEHSLYLLSGVLLTVLLRSRYQNNRGALLFFCFFSFNTVLTCHESLRVIRDVIYVSETGFVFYAMLGVIFSYEGEGNVVLWNSILGLTLIPFWLTREEGIWILPSLFVLTFYITINYIIKGDGQKKIRMLFILFIPYIMILAGAGIVSAVNYLNYGLNITTEFQIDYFKSAYGALTRVKGEKWRRYVQVPRDVRDKIYNVSPAFHELKPYLEGDASKSWIRVPGETYIRPADDFSSHFVWAFRDAVADCGYYDSPQRAMAYYNRLADEINLACEEGRLDCHGARQTMAPVFRQEYVPLTFKRLIDSFIYVNSFKFSIGSYPKIMGPSCLVSLFEKITSCDGNERIKQVSISGWCFSVENEVGLGVKKKDEQFIVPVNFIPSPEIYSRLEKENRLKDIERAKKCRFSLTVSPDDTDLVYIQNGKVIKTYDLSVITQAVDIGSDKGPLLFELSITSPFLKGQSSVDRAKILILKKIGGFYEWVVSKLFLAALASFALCLVFKTFRKADRVLIIFNFLLLTAIFSRHVLLSYLDVTTFNGVNVVYHLPTYALTIIFIGFSLFDLSNTFYPLLKRRLEHKDTGF